MQKLLSLSLNICSGCMGGVWASAQLQTQDGLQPNYEPHKLRDIWASAQLRTKRGLQPNYEPFDRRGVSIEEVMI